MSGLHRGCLHVTIYLGPIRVIFRTNDERNFLGFQANIICVDPDEGNLEGCTRPPGSNMTDDEGSSPEETQRRRKRDLENFVSVCILVTEIRLDSPVQKEVATNAMTHKINNNRPHPLIHFSH